MNMLQDCSVMKIDVEGHEAKALIGGAHFLSSDKAPLIIRTDVNVEMLSANNITKAGYYWIYHALGYRPISIHDGKVYPLKNMERTREPSLTGNFRSQGIRSLECSGRTSFLYVPVPSCWQK